jgi:hypothetical protein
MIKTFFFRHHKCVSERVFLQYPDDSMWNSNNILSFPKIVREIWASIRANIFEWKIERVFSNRIAVINQTVHYIEMCPFMTTITNVCRFSSSSNLCSSSEYLFIVFDLTRPRIEHMIFHTRGEHVNMYMIVTHSNNQKKSKYLVDWLISHCLAWNG